MTNLTYAAQDTRTYDTGFSQSHTLVERHERTVVNYNFSFTRVLHTRKHTLFFFVRAFVGAASRSGDRHR